MNESVLDLLHKAKAHSDEGRYSQKHAILRKQMDEAPEDFEVDSDDGKGIVGVTHTPTGYRFHMPKQKVHPELKKAAFDLNIGKRIGSGLAHVMRAIPQAPLFGREVADAARSHGTHIATVAEDAADTKGIPWLTNILRDRNTRVYHQESKIPAKAALGAFVDFGGHGPEALKGTPFVGRRSTRGEELAGRMGGSKAVEAANLPSLVGDTGKLSDIARDAGIDPNDAEGLHAELKRRFGGRFIVKPDGGSMNSADSMPTEARPAQTIMDYIQGRPKDFVAQRRIDAAPMSRPFKASNNLSEMYWQGRLGGLANIASSDPALRDESKGLWRAALGGKADFPLEHSLTGGKGDEYRVHVIDGKVVPYATAHRGSMLGLFPWRTSTHGEVERAVQSKLDSLGHAERNNLKGTFGFDVMRGQNADKGWHVIETNPSEIHGGSGFISSHPFAQEAVAAAIEGRMPRHIVAQRALQGAAGVGAAYGGYQALGGLTRGDSNAPA